ncbi:MAG: glycosyltransferase family 9 protein [candidate division Zixibacteria bacterium]
MNNPRKILIIRPDRLGDLILSLPVAEALKKHISEIEVHYLVSQYTSGVSSLVDYVDGWLIDENNDGGRLSVVGLKNKIKSGGYDCLIELKPSWRTASAGYLADVSTRIGTSRRAYSIFYNKRINVSRKSSGYHQSDLELTHLRPLGIDIFGLNPRLEADETGKSKAAELLAINRKRYIVIHPGSGGSSPNWPLENYINLAVQINRQTGQKVVVTNHDNNIGGFENCLNIGGKTDIKILAGVLTGASIFISGSTGPLHLADALGTTCVSFFSNREDVGAVRWGPRRNMENVIMPGEICRCGKTEHCRCLERVGVEEAFNKVRAVLNSGKGITVGDE